MKKIKKQLLGVLICVALLLSSVYLPMEAKATDTVTTVAGAYSQERIREYITYGLAPTMEGKVFAGWYNDSGTWENYVTSVNDVNANTVAKFVDEKVLSVKLQVSGRTTSEATVGDVRFLTSVDTLNYQKVSFKIDSTGNTNPVFAATTAYTKVIAGGATYEPDVFSADSQYIVTSIWDGIGKGDTTDNTYGNFGTSIEVTPSWTTMDGTVVKGTKRTFEINDGIYSAEVTVTDADENKTTTWYADLNDYGFADSGEVYIKMLKDCTLTNKTVDMKTSDVDVTIDGQGQYTLSTSHTTSTANIFLINSANVTLRFQDMDVAHNAERPLVWVNQGKGTTVSDSGIGVSFENVTMTVGSAKDYAYGLINMRSATTLHMKRTTVTFTSNVEKTYQRTIIRGGDGNEGITLGIQMEDCTMTANSTGHKRSIIQAQAGNTANVTLINSTLTTNAQYPVYKNGGTLNLKCDEYTNTHWSYTGSDNSINAISNVTPVTDNETETEINGVKYLMSLSDALTKAKTAGCDVTIKLLKDCSVSTGKSITAAGTKLTIDGQGHTLTATTASGTVTGNTVVFGLEANDITFEFQNLNIDHRTQDRLINVYKDGSRENIHIVWEDVHLTTPNAVASQDQTKSSVTAERSPFLYGLINIREKVCLTMKNSSIDCNIDETNTTYYRTDKTDSTTGELIPQDLISRGMIRLGQTAAQEAVVQISNTTIDTSGAINQSAIHLDGANQAADITLTNVNINTKNKDGIVDPSNKVTLRTSGGAYSYADTSGTHSLYSGTGTNKSFETTEVAIDGFGYETLTDAWNVAQKIGGEVTIAMLKDCSLTETMTLSTSNCHIVLDGQGQYQLTLGTDNVEKNILVIGKENATLNNASLKLQNMTVNQETRRAVVNVAYNLSGSGYKVTLEKTILETAYGMGDTTDENAYGWMNFRSSAALSMEDVRVNFAEDYVGYDNRGVIRLGNGGENITVDVDMKDCMVDATNGLGRAIVIARGGNTANINLDGCEFRIAADNTTANGKASAPIHIRTYTDNSVRGVATLTYDSTCVWKKGGETLTSVLIDDGVTDTTVTTTTE